MVLTPGTKIGPYEIQSPLGTGGMGEVYRARDTRLKPEVAIKVLRADLTSDADLPGRFVQEAQAVCALQHPNICVVHDIGSQQDLGSGDHNVYALNASTGALLWSYKTAISASWPTAVAPHRCHSALSC